MRLTRAVTHIHLCDANHAKIAALDVLAAAYQDYLDLLAEYPEAGTAGAARD